MRIFSGDPKCHEAAHGKSRDTTVFPIRERAVMRVDIFNKLWIIYWKLPKSFHRVNIVGSQIVLFTWPTVVAIRLDYNYIMGGNKICNIITLVVISFIKFFKFLATVSEIALGPAVEKINNRVLFLGIVKIAGR